jgi:Iap family predicted aminopeptidase
MQGRRIAEENPAVFDAQSALDIIRNLNFIRVCGSEGERRGMDVVTRILDETGISWRYHTFRNKWLEPNDPHLLVRGREIAIRPAMELSFQHGADFVTNKGSGVDVQADLAPAGDCAGKIAIAEHFNQERLVGHGAVAKLMAFPFDQEMESHLWLQQERDKQRVPVAIIAPEDIPLVLDALGEPAALKWSVRMVEREFRNLVAEIPGRQRPDEIVVMGAHMDSWPGTVGASDDAAGCAVLVEAAKWFFGHPPARTVRLTWFTGEEVDARGSRTYVSECVEDPSAVKLMVLVDSTCEKDSGAFVVYTSDEPTFEWARQHLDLDGMEHFISKGGGTDATAFIAAGIPDISFEAPYKETAQIGHLPDDTPENIDPRRLQVLGFLSLGAAIHATCGCTI